MQNLSLAGDDKAVDSTVNQCASQEYDCLREHYLFSGLEPADFDTLTRTISEVNVDKGEILFHQGDRAEYFYFVEVGHVELNLIAPTGQKKVLEVIGPDRIFAEAVVFMRGHKYPVTCEALTETKLIRIPNQAYLNLIQDKPDACLRLLADISRQLHAKVQEIERLTVQNARDRLVSYLLDHVIDKNGDEATIRVELPRHVIAARLSITPETLSRLLRNLVDERIIAIEDRLIFVHSLLRLRPYD
jgi:CRP-like cAMP-binding protein